MKPLSAQTPTISGVINDYIPVREVADYGRKIYVTNATDASVGDWLLLIQHQGAGSADADECDGPPGHVTSYDAAGNFELVRVKAIDTNPPAPYNLMDMIELEERMKMFYYACDGCDYRDGFPRGTTYGFQAVVVPHFDGDVDITGPVMAEPWDGETGGVVALVAEGTVTLKSNIDVSGKGFNGGAPSANNLSTDQMDYVSNPDDYFAGSKGEGITDVLKIGAPFNSGRAVYEESAGRGALANGGGGGNAGNAGGGGGGNYGTGGRGGKQNFAYGDLEIGGEGGFGLAYRDKLPYAERKRTQVFFGGGGGGGHRSNASGATDSKGGAGGGIVLILADKLSVQNTGSTFGRWIVANGDPGMPGNLGANGAGGGGAGGAILLDVNEIEVDDGVLTVQAKGGDGGNTTNASGLPRTGPGGGGGGGVLWLRMATTPANVDYNSGTYGTLQGGNAGQSNNGSPSVYGAGNGEAGTVLHNLKFPKWYAPDESPI